MKQLLFLSAVPDLSPVTSSSWIMHPLILILLLAAVHACDCEVVYWQELSCPYELKHEGLQRVWCRQSSSDCCDGFTFSQSAHSVDGGKVRVTQGPDSFSVAVLQPTYGAGMYWCGVLSLNGTIIKLAEGYFHSSHGAFIWSVARWMLLPLLPMVVIFTNICIRKTTKHKRKKAEELYDDITTSRALVHPEYENESPVVELD